MGRRARASLRLCRHTIAAVWVVRAATDAQAERLASSAAMAFALLQRGRLVPVPPVNEALRFLEVERARPSFPGRSRRRIVGAPETVRAGIEAAAREYAADEMMIVTITHDHAARRRSYELIAEAFELAAQPEVELDLAVDQA